MEKTEWEKLNTVEGENQVSLYVKFEGKPGGSPRVMFLGNSITWHAPKAEIGWHGDWGMAASSKENDYAHIMMRKISERYPDAYFCIVQGAIWERTYKDCDYEGNFSAAKDFNPDIIISKLVDNIPNAEFEHEPFIENMGKLHKYLSGTRDDVSIIETSSFGTNEIKDKAIKAYTEKAGAKYIYIGDINKNPENLAIGLFEHGGVAGHPGDKGMQVFADRLLNCIKENNMLKRASTVIHIP